ncbi:FHA domain-containing protein FHA2 [Sesamum indicum]|uniref:FHA domain-containing protein FHA2 n=1 Tax=Sesamum indicum TaxID=4182 RepID=A0A6I9TX64_SESIN|nr:FHA domain-containing protein FHA2 [Sesamum indicum]
MGSSGGSDVEAGFAKLQGEDFEYYMQTYSIILGRNSKKSSVDVDLSSLGGGMNISRHHARIFYDFQRRRFALEVLGKNGCFVEGVLHLPGNPPVKLDSQDLLQIGDKEFYFLLPVRSILGGPIGPRHHVSNYQMGGSAHQYHHAAQSQQQHHLGLPPPPAPGGGTVGYGKKGRTRGEYYEDEYNEDDGGEDGSSGAKKMRRGDGVDGSGSGGYGYGSGGKAGASGQMEKKGDARSRADREADNQQLLQLEEKDVVSSVATVLSDLCGPGEWMPMEKLHSELVEQFGNIWHHSRVRRYLASEDYSSPEAKGKPWYGLLMLLRKYPEHFVINTRSKGRVALEFVSLVSLLS